MKIDQVGCARCHGEGHEQIEFAELTHPLQIGDVTLTHWAPCPTNGEPILLGMVDSLGAAVPLAPARAAYLPPDGLPAPEGVAKAALDAYGWRGPRDVESPLPDDAQDGD